MLHCSQPFQCINNGCVCCVFAECKDISEQGLRVTLQQVPVPGVELVHTDTYGHLCLSTWCELLGCVCACEQNSVLNDAATVQQQVVIALWLTGGDSE